MTEHLPECCVGPNGCKAEPCQRCHACCICEQLRACEQRCDEKRHAEVRAWSELSRDNFDHGFAAGLDAAREAVAALPCMAGRGQDRHPRHVDDFKDAVLAAIDALKENP